MPLHLKRLAVGVTSIDHLAEFQAGRLAEVRAGGGDGLFTMTRMVPRRAAELVDGGSLYWIIGGLMRVRQRILAIDEGHDGAGRRFCRIGIDAELIRVQARAHRPFQGWRYFKPADAPPDLAGNEATAEEALPDHLADELRALGLLG